jgi:hypothetical protein
MATQQQIEDYFQLLERHDWFYAYSDDHRVWLKGEEERKELERRRDEDRSGVLYRMYFAYAAFMNSGHSTTHVLKPRVEDYL